MLLELAVGDAYGAGFEYRDASAVAMHNTLEHYLVHRRQRIAPGCYTDDTQMSIAVAEAIISGEEWTRALVARSFVHAFKRDPREGYAAGFYHFLQHVETADQFLAEIDPRSDKSGAAMRAGPIGVFSSIAVVKKRATLQARLTHDTTDGINAAVAAALATHYFLYNLGPKASLGTFLERHVAGQWALPWYGAVGSKGWMSVRAAITAIERNGRMSDLLKDCIAFTGDVDTVATLALAMGSRHQRRDAACRTTQGFVAPTICCGHCGGRRQEPPACAPPWPERWARCTAPCGPPALMRPPPVRRGA